MTGPFKAALKLATPFFLASTAVHAADSAEVYSHSIITIPPVQVQESWVRLFDTKEEWEEFFESAYAQTGQSAAAPEIDFTRWRVVAGGTGRKNSGGTQLVIDRVYDMSTSVLVAGYVINAGPACSVTAAITYPTIAVVIPQSTRPVQVGMLPAVFNCDSQSRYIPVN